MVKVEAYKEEQRLKKEAKSRWEQWKKTKAVLHNKMNLNQRKWDFFQDDESEEEELPFIPPDDPNFRALEKDIDERKARKLKQKIASEEFKTKGNAFMKEGK